MNTKNELDEILIEYAAIKFALNGIKPDFLKLYSLNHKTTSENQKYIMQSVSNWKNQNHLKQLYKTTVENTKAILTSSKINLKNGKLKDDLKLNGSDDGDFFGNGSIDFTNKAEFIDYLNNQVNLIQDDKQRLDYLKILSDLLRFKEDSNKGTEDVQRFYIPLTCNNCKLYQAQKEPEPEK